jgi:hypothetical protein
MPRYGLVRRIWLTRFSSPAAERPIYRHVLRTAPRRILELGLGTLLRTERLLGVAASLQAAGELHYVGLDRFEARLPTDPPGVTLKQAHQRLHARARVQLAPGNIDTSLSRLCNHLGGFDMVIISAGIDARHLERCWFFLQRVTTAATTVFLEHCDGTAARWATLPKARIDELAAKTVLRRAG